MLFDLPAMRADWSLWWRIRHWIEHLRYGHAGWSETCFESDGAVTMFRCACGRLYEPRTTDVNLAEVDLGAT